MVPVDEAPRENEQQEGDIQMVREDIGELSEPDEPDGQEQIVEGTYIKA